MNCRECEDFGKYWCFDESGRKKIWENWERNWTGCRLGNNFARNPRICPKNAKIVKTIE